MLLAEIDRQLFIVLSLSISLKISQVTRSETIQSAKPRSVYVCEIYEKHKEKSNWKWKGVIISYSIRS